MQNSIITRGRSYTFTTNSQSPSEKSKVRLFSPQTEPKFKVALQQDLDDICEPIKSFDSISTPLNKAKNYPTTLFNSLPSEKSSSSVSLDKFSSTTKAKAYQNICKTYKHWKAEIDQKLQQGVEALNIILKNKAYSLTKNFPKYQNIEELIEADNIKTDLSLVTSFYPNSLNKANLLFSRLPGAMKLITADKLSFYQQQIILSGNSRAIATNQILPIITNITSDAHTSYNQFTRLIQEPLFLDNFIIVAAITTSSSNNYATEQSLVDDKLWAAIIFDLYQQNKLIRLVFQEALSSINNPNPFAEFENLNNIDNLTALKYQELQTKFAQLIPKQLGILALPKYMLTHL